MNPTLIITAVIAAMAAMAGFGAAWQLQAANITQLTLEHANERIATQDSIRTALEANTRQVAAAQSGAARRGIGNRAAADRAAAAGNGLRVQTASVVRTAATDPATCTHATTALATVFDQCAAELATLGATADRHASDIQTLTDSWPGGTGAPATAAAMPPAATNP